MIKFSQNIFQFQGKIFLAGLMLFLSITGVNAGRRDEFNPKRIELPPGKPILVHLDLIKKELIVLLETGEITKWDMNTTKKIYTNKIRSKYSEAYVFQENIIGIAESDYLHLLDFTGKILSRHSTKFHIRGAEKIGPNILRITRKDQERDLLLEVPSFKKFERNSLCGRAILETGRILDDECKWEALIIDNSEDIDNTRATPLHFVNLTTKKVTAKIKDFSRMPFGDLVTFSNHGKYFLHASGNNLSLYNPPDGRLLLRLSGYFGLFGSMFYDQEGFIHIAVTDWSPVSRDIATHNVYLYHINKNLLDEHCLKKYPHLVMLKRNSLYEEPDKKNNTIEKLRMGQILGYSHQTGKYCNAKTQDPWVMAYLPNNSMGYLCMENVKINMQGSGLLPKTIPDVIEITGSFVDDNNKPLEKQPMHLVIDGQVITEFRTNHDGEYKVPVLVELLTTDQRKKFLAGNFSFDVLLWGRVIGTYKWTGKLPLNDKAIKKQNRSLPKKRKLKK